MQVVFHLGAPCTDLGLLLGSLLKNRALLAEDGIIAPPLMRYRAVLRDTARALAGRPAGIEVQQALLEAIVDEARVDRLIFSDPRLVCINRLVVQGPQIWPMIDRQAANLRSARIDARPEDHDYQEERQHRFESDARACVAAL